VGGASSRPLDAVQKIDAMSTGFQVGSVKRKDRASTMLNPKSTGNICAAPDESSYLAGTSDASSSFARPCGPAPEPHGIVGASSLARRRRNSPCWDDNTWAPDSIRRDRASSARNLEGPQYEVSDARRLSQDPQGTHRACRLRRLPDRCWSGTCMAPGWSRSSPVSIATSSR
jgi:hypothetical protein